MSQSVDRLRSKAKKLLDHYLGLLDVDCSYKMLFASVWLLSYLAELGLISHQEFETHLDKLRKLRGFGSEKPPNDRVAYTASYATRSNGT